MVSLNTVTLVVNSFTVVMTLSFLTIILWHNRTKEQNQFFAYFLFAVTFWSVGSLLSIATTVTGTNFLTDVTAQNLMQLGFNGASVTMYAFVAVLLSVRPPRFHLIVLGSLGVVVAYQLLLSQIQGMSAPNQLQVGIFLIFSGTTLYLVWRYRARMKDTGLRIGFTLFILGQCLGLLNPQLRTLSISVMISSAAVLILGLSILNREIIQPLKKRNSQVEAMHNMSLAITSQLAVHTVMEQIAQQAGTWLNADGVGIFLKEGNLARLNAVYGLPEQYVGLSLPASEGIAGKVISTKKSTRFENYSRQWKHVPDLPLAMETFGSVACVPLVAGDEAIGALMVIAGKHNRSFSAEDVYLLEMLGAQAAIAITHSQLFTNQQRLNDEIEEAKNRFETLLTSTENPVVALNRDYELIFANDAAKRLFPELHMAQPITEILPRDVLPDSLIDVYRNIRKQRTHVYELIHRDRIYMTQLTMLGVQDNIQGWVAVLNDVTQLKELDRLKSEMIRMTSHDLKNPLQAAMANIDLLLEVLDDHPDEDVQYSVTSIDKQLGRMFRIISGVLDMERIRTGTRTMQICQPSVILKNAVTDLQQPAATKGIELAMEIEDKLPYFQGDPGQMERALSNLLENAIKFTPANGTVQASAYMDNSCVIFSVKDNGIGIPEEDQSRVFDSFFRANQRGAEHITGTGLGLHLVKTVVENHQGKVWLESGKELGTTFYISIPATSEDIMSNRAS